MNPDDIVSTHGETVEHEWVADAAFDTDYHLDEDASTIEAAQRQAVVSSPSDEAFKRLEGRGSRPRFELTLPSGTDVRADREGRPDRFRIRGEYCQVEDVRRDSHLMADVEKLTVTVSGLDGR